MDNEDCAGDKINISDVPQPPADLEHSISQLSHQLSMLGYQEIDRNDAKEYDIASLVRSTTELLQRHENLKKIKEEMDKTNRMTQSDLNEAHATQVKLREHLHNTQRSADSLQETCRQQKESIRNLQNQLKQQKEENRKATALSSQKQVQHQHESRKLERDNSMLKERLRQTLTERSVDKKLGITMINALPRSDGQRSRWKSNSLTSQSNKDVNKVVLSSYEARQNDLLHENLELRKCLKKIHEEFSAVLSKKPPADSENLHPNMKMMIPTKELFDMPFKIAGDRIEGYLKDSWSDVKTYIAHLEALAGRRKLGATSQEELQVLRHQFEDIDDMLKKNECLDSESEVTIVVSGEERTLELADSVSSLSVESRVRLTSSTASFTFPDGKIYHVSHPSYASEFLSTM